VGQVDLRLIDGSLGPLVVAEVLDDVFGGVVQSRSRLLVLDVRSKNPAVGLIGMGADQLFGDGPSLVPLVEFGIDVAQRGKGRDIGRRQRQRAIGFGECNVTHGLVYEVCVAIRHQYVDQHHPVLLQVRIETQRFRQVHQRELALSARIRVVACGRQGLRGGNLVQHGPEWSHVAAT